MREHFNKFREIIAQPEQLNFAIGDRVRIPLSNGTEDVGIIREFKPKVNAEGIMETLVVVEIQGKNAISKIEVFTLKKLQDAQVDNDPTP